LFYDAVSNAKVLYLPATYCVFIVNDYFQLSKKSFFYLFQGIAITLKTASGISQKHHSL